jgi:hypothetical protein
MRKRVVLNENTTKLGTCDAAFNLLIREMLGPGLDLLFV